MRVLYISQRQRASWEAAVGAKVTLSRSFMKKAGRYGLRNYFKSVFKSLDSSIFQQDGEDEGKCRGHKVLVPTISTKETRDVKHTGLPSLSLEEMDISVLPRRLGYSY